MPKRISTKAVARYASGVIKRTRRTSKYTHAEVLALIITRDTGAVFPRPGQPALFNFDEARAELTARRGDLRRPLPSDAVLVANRMQLTYSDPVCLSQARNDRVAEVLRAEAELSAAIDAGLVRVTPDGRLEASDVRRRWLGKRRAGRRPRLYWNNTEILRFARHMRAHARAEVLDDIFDEQQPSSVAMRLGLQPPGPTDRSTYVAAAQRRALLDLAADERYGLVDAATADAQRRSIHMWTVRRGRPSK